MSACKTVALGDLVEPAKTWNPSRSRPDEVFSYIDLSAVDQDTKLIAGAREISCSEAPSRARQLVAKGDVLVSTVRPNLNGVARVPEELDGATASTGFCVLRPRPALLDCDYIFHWVKSPKFVADMVNKATGASYLAVSDRIIFGSRLPLPPLNEQRRIAEVLDRAEALRAKRRAALAQLDTLTQVLFLDLFGPSGKRRSHCRPLPLGLLCRSITDGVHKTPNYVAAGVPFVTVKNIASGNLNLSDTKFISQEDHITFTKRTKPERGDVLVSKDGTIGVSCPITTDDEFSIFVSVALLKRKPELIEQTFLVTQFRTSSVQHQIRASSKGIAIRHLHLEDFKRLVLVVPPIFLQQEFGRRVAAIEKLKASYRASLAEFDALFASLQHRAFRGEL